MPGYHWAVGVHIRLVYEPVYQVSVLQRFDHSRLEGICMAILSGRRILVLEEEAPAALLLEKLLRELGCHVPGRAGKAADAVAIIETDRLGLDAATLELGGEGSGEVAAVLEGRGIPFIITTGPDSPLVSGQFKDRPVLHRPFLIEDLKSALEALDMKHRHSNR